MSSARRTAVRAVSCVLGRPGSGLRTGAECSTGSSGLARPPARPGGVVTGGTTASGSSTHPDGARAAFADGHVSCRRSYRHSNPRARAARVASARTWRGRLNRTLRTPPGGGGPSAPLPGRPARRRRGRTAAGRRGIAHAVRQRRRGRAGRRSPCRTRVRLRWSTVSSGSPKPRDDRQRTSTTTSAAGGPGSTATRSSSWRPTWTFRARMVQPAVDQADQDQRSRRRHPPAGPRSGSGRAGRAFHDAA